MKTVQAAHIHSLIKLLRHGEGRFWAKMWIAKAMQKVWGDLCMGLMKHVFLWQDFLHPDCGIVLMVLYFKESGFRSIVEQRVRRWLLFCNRCSALDRSTMLSQRCYSEAKGGLSKKT